VKFYLVPIGEQFSFQDKDYTKSGPLTASAESDGENKMIPRSANVTLLNSRAVIEEKVSNEKFISIIDAASAVSAYHAQCLKCLDSIKSEVDKNIFYKIETKIDMAYRELEKSIQR